VEETAGCLSIWNSLVYSFAFNRDLAFISFPDYAVYDVSVR
jgi:hypothetical protein